MNSSTRFMTENETTSVIFIAQILLSAASPPQHPLPRPPHQIAILIYILMICIEEWLSLQERCREHPTLTATEHWSAGHLWRLIKGNRARHKLLNISIRCHDGDWLHGRWLRVCATVLISWAGLAGWQLLCCQRVLFSFIAIITNSSNGDTKLSYILFTKE